ncbi:GGDEF domain-containing protein [Cellulomonas endophytica]|uniref:GGDEF domain-containing protein n=1 Tax=Cellulomonas endophytica TaxID=2494735 RepID=UPI0010124280|nr:GGDEF domain-containing protein [Cellulomonas endophytica]
MTGGPAGAGGAAEASLLRVRLSAVLDTTLDPLILVRPVREGDRVVDFVIDDLNGTHARAGGDPRAQRMRLPERSPELFALYRRVLATGTTQEARRVRIEGHPEDPTSASGWADVRATAVAGDVVVSWRNVDADVLAERALREQAMQDPLTGLPNRRALVGLLAAACAAHVPFGVLFVDVDRFKELNDRYGHATGDAVLAATGERLRSALRGDDVVGRLAGDEFVVVAPRAGTREDVGALAARVVDAPAPTGAGAPAPSVSVGALLVDDPSADVDGVLRAADALMYAAKREGGGRVRVGGYPRGAGGTHDA